MDRERKKKHATEPKQHTPAMDFQLQLESLHKREKELQNALRKTHVESGKKFKGMKPSKATPKMGRTKKHHDEFEDERWEVDEQLHISPETSSSAGGSLRNSFNQTGIRLVVPTTETPQGNNSRETYWLNIDTCDSLGNTVLHRAIINNDIKMVKELVLNNCDINKRDKSQKTPLILAMKLHHWDIAEYLIDSCADVNETDKLIRGRLLKKILGARDLNVNITNQFGNTPLILALYDGDIEGAEMLLHMQAEPNLPNLEGKYPLHFACETNSLEAAAKLLEFGACINCVDKNGVSPLHSAVKSHTEANQELVALLLEKGANSRLVMRLTAQDLITTSPQITKKIESFNPSSKYWKFEIDPSYLHINFGEIIGTGAHSEVYMGKLHGTPVAVKIPKKNCCDFSEAAHEIGLMSAVHHPNILNFLGTCEREVEGETTLCIITEFLDGGSLDNFVNTKHPLPFRTILKCAIDIARGLAWLHSRNPPVLHRDLHSNNILISKTEDCKVCDFGLSQIFGGTQVKSRIYKRIQPPEIREKLENYSPKSDTYMFGLVLHQLLTKKKELAVEITDSSFEVLMEEFTAETIKEAKSVPQEDDGPFGKPPVARSGDQFLINPYVDNYTSSGHNSSFPLITTTTTTPTTFTTTQNISEDAYTGEEVKLSSSNDSRVITGFGLEITPTGSVKVGAKKRRFFESDEGKEATPSIEKPGVRTANSEAIRLYLHLIRDCLCTESARRPTFIEILERLEEIARRMTEDL